MISIWYDGCSGCYTGSYEDDYIMAVNWMLEDGGHHLPELYETKSTYRIVHPYRWFVEDEHLVHCEEEWCCWARYSVTNTGSGYDKSKIEGTSNYQVCTTQGCYTFCDSWTTKLPSRIIELKYSNLRDGFQTVAKPNPTKNKIDLSILSRENGNLIIKIFDSKGNQINELA